MNRVASSPHSQPSAEAGSSADDLALAQLLVQLGAEVGAPLALALERLHEQLQRVERGAQSPLLSLREPLRRARDAALLAAQVGRLRSGRVVPGKAPIGLHRLLHQAAETRRREAHGRGLQIRADLNEAEIIADPALVASLIQALLDWALIHTRSSIELQLAISAWPAQARLQCRFAYRDLDQASHAPTPPTLNGLRWMLVVHTAKALNIALHREDEAGLCVTRLDFPLMVRDAELQLTAMGDTNAEEGGQDTQPFAGWKALLVSDRSEFQGEVGSLLQGLGWAIDRARSVDEAFQQVLQALPQAIVVDSALAGPDLTQWRLHVLAEAPGFCFVEVDDGTASPRKSDGLRCARQRLSTELPLLLRQALAPKSANTALTFRI